MGRRDLKDSRVGAAATSSVRSFQPLIVLGEGERRIFGSLYGTGRALGTRENGNDGLF